MDGATDFECAGRYGTIKFIRKESFELITSYPVDAERTTFGRDPKCNVRLYFHDVDPHHCTLEHDDGKMFLHVISPRGVLVDGVLVGGGQTVSLYNHSRFQLYLKLFEFEYPPAEMRNKMLSTPRSKSRKSIRMSMIPSAFILTPTRTSPTLDMKVLQSPIRPYRESPDEIVTFVESDQVAVVEDAPAGPSSPATFVYTTGAIEEDSSLVALEEVDEDEEPTPRPLGPYQSPFRSSTLGPGSPYQRRPQEQHYHRSSTVHIPPSPNVAPPGLRSPMLKSSSRPLTGSNAAASPPRTPRPRRKGPSLHKAVLVRSAHRAFVAAIEKQHGEGGDDEDIVEDGAGSTSAGQQPVPALQLQGDAINPIAEEDGELDADGEDDVMQEEEPQLVEPPSPSVSSPSGMIRASLGLLGSILPSFGRSSQSPPPALPTEPAEQEIQDTEEAATNQEVEEVAEEVPDQTAMPLKPRASFSAPPQRPAQSLNTPTRPKASSVRFQLWTPQNKLSHAQQKTGMLKTVGAAPRDPAVVLAAVDENDDQDEDEENADTVREPRRPRVSFSGPVVRPFGPALDLDKPSVVGKPIRPRGRVTLDSRSEDIDMEDADNEELDEESSKAAELRAQERQQKLAALDAAPRRLADPSTRRLSVQKAAMPPSTTKLGVPPTPDRRTYTSLQVPEPVPALVLHPDPVVVEEDQEMESDESDEEVVNPSLDQLRLNIAVMKRDSIARASRLSVGGPRIGSVPPPLTMVLSQGDLENTDDKENEPISSAEQKHPEVEAGLNVEFGDMMDVDENGGEKSSEETPVNSSSSQNEPQSQEDSDDPVESRSLPPSKPAPGTPRFTGLREMLALPTEVPKTPLFSGVRDMFRDPQPVAPTPSFEGMQELFPEEEEEAAVAEALSGGVSLESVQPLVEANEEHPEPTVQSTTTAKATTAETASQARGRSKPTLTALPTSRLAVPAKTQTARKVSRPLVDAPENAPKEPPTRRTASRATAPVEPIPAPRPATLRTRRAAAPVEAAPSSSKPSSVSRAKATTSSKTAVETLTRVDGGEVIEVSSSSSKSTASTSKSSQRTVSSRIARANPAKSTVNPEASAQEVGEEAIVSRPTTRSRTPGAQKSPGKRAREDDDDADPLDSLPSKRDLLAASVLAAGTRVKRSTRAKAEDEVQNPADPSHDSNARKRRKPSPPDVTPPESSAASKQTDAGRSIAVARRRTPAAATSTTRRTPSARSTSSTTAGPDKENTPDATADQEESRKSSEASASSSAKTTRKPSATTKLPTSRQVSMEPSNSAARSLRTRVKK